MSLTIHHATGWKAFLFFFFFSLQSGKLFLSFPIVSLSCRGRSTAPFNSLDWINFFEECLEATWGQANTLHVAVAWVSSPRENTWVNHNVASQGHCTAFVDTAAGSGKVRLQLEGQKYLGGNLGTSPATSLNVTCPSCSTLLPLCLTVSKESWKDVKTSFARGVLMGTFSYISSDGYVQSPFSTCVTTTRAVGAPWLQSWTQAGLK